MKVTESEALDLTNKLMDGFSELLKDYLLKMGLRVVPVMKLKPITSWTKSITIDEIITIVNREIGSSYPKGIKTKRNIRYLVIRRQIIGYIASKLKYGCEEIGRKIGKNHATVLHGNSTVHDKLNIGNEEMIETYNKINYLINAYYIEKYGEDIQEITKGRD